MEAQKITITVNSEPPFLRLKMRAQDNGRSLQVYVVDSDSQALDMSEITPEFRAKRPNGTEIAFTEAVSIIEKTSVLLGNIPIARAIQDTGIIACEIILYESNGKSIGTVPFEIDVWEPVVRDEGIQSTTEYQSAVAAAVAAEAAAEAAADSSEKARAAANQSEQIYAQVLEIEHNPVIVGENGNLWNWDSSAGEYVDSGISGAGGGDMRRSVYDPAEAGETVGPVEQAGGIPSYVSTVIADHTNIESGANTNGYYIKYPDGTLICTKRVETENYTIDTAAGTNIYRGPVISVGEFAEIFVGWPVVQRTMYSDGGHTCWQMNIGRACALARASTGTLTLNAVLDVTAIGRWK